MAYGTELFLARRRRIGRWRLGGLNDFIFNLAVFGAGNNRVASFLVHEVVAERAVAGF